IESMDLPVEKAKLIVSEFRSLSVSQELKPETINTEKLNDLIKYSAKPAIDKKVGVNYDLKKLPDITGDTQKLSDCFGEMIRNSLHFIMDEKKEINGKVKKEPHIKISTGLAKLAELPEKIDKTKEYIKIVFSDN